MSHGELFERHPLCTCPELTWSALTGEATTPDLQACRDRAFGGIDPHPVISTEEMREITAQLTGRMGMSG